MATNIILPKFGFTQESSEIVAWLVQEGDYVDEGDPIAEVTTDKVNMEVEAPCNGYLSAIRYAVGAEVTVTDIIAEMVATEAEVRAAQPAEPVAVAPEKKVAAQPPATDKVRATPAARRAARQLGVSLAGINGTGPRGRIQVADVERRGAAQRSADFTTPPPQINGTTHSQQSNSRSQPLNKMRRAIATNLQTSWQQAPHIFFTANVDVTELLQCLTRLNSTRSDGDLVTVTAMLTKVVAWALQQHPRINCHFSDDMIITHDSVNIGMAVALDEGLVVPVIHSAENIGLATLSTMIRDTAARARSGKLRANDLTGATFTISNLGMFGIDTFTAIINPPQVGILAVGTIDTQFLADSAGNPQLRDCMSVTLSVDHRVVDGAVAAQFMRTLKNGLEQVERLLL